MRGIFSMANTALTSTTLVPMGLLLSLGVLGGCTQSEPPPKASYPEADQVFLVLQEDVTGSATDFIPENEKSRPYWVPPPKKGPVTKLSDLPVGQTVDYYQPVLTKMGYQIQDTEESASQTVYDIRKDKERYRVTLKKFYESDKKDFVWSVSVEPLISIAEFKTRQTQKVAQENAGNSSG